MRCTSTRLTAIWQPETRGRFHLPHCPILGVHFYGLLDPEVVVGRINRSMTGWANYFCLGQVSPAYAAIDRHATRRLRQWLCRKHKVRFGKVVRFPDPSLWKEYGLTHLAPRTVSFPWAKA